ncbi:MAG: alpha/beta fold hydrolase [Candidatus Thorarchaeota archaeon]
MECDLENIKIYYEIYGEGRPVLMIHGWTVDHRIMKGCMEPIFKTRPNYERIYFDLPGMGKSKSKEWITNSDDFLKITIDFIENIIPDQNFIVVSESYGCYLARGLIKKKYNLIDGILFLVPVIIAKFDNRILPKPNILVKDSNLLSTLSTFELESVENVATIINQKTWKRGKEEGLSAVKIADLKFLNKIQEKGYEFSFDVDNSYASFDKPTLFFLGRQDSNVGYRDAWKIIEKFPRATFAVLDKAGHIAQIEQEELFNALVNDWLDRVEDYNPFNK